MGFVDKLKNALFEEVEEEVEEKEEEEKPKKEKVKKNSVKDKLLKREKEEKERKEREKDRKEKPIAKKVVLEDTLDERVDYHELRDEDFDIEALTDDLNDRVKSEEVAVPSFTVIDESDLIVEDYKEQKPLIKTQDVVEENKAEEISNDEIEEFDYYDDNYSKPYGIDRDNDIRMHEYGAISRKEEKSIFRPSPIISPIYGILDKNYKKEDIVNKRETHITSSYERRNLSVDDVRKKAYGTISDDLIDDMDREIEQEKEAEVVKNDDNLLVDLSDDSKKPEIDKITMGDAEEYFEDLGLEYNVDYVDASKEKEKEKEQVEEAPKKEKRERDNYEDIEEEIEEEDVVEDVSDISEDFEEEIEQDIVEDKEEIEEVEEKEDEEEKKETPKREDRYSDEGEEEIEDDDDNLFDLIDSMYQEKE